MNLKVKKVKKYKTTIIPSRPLFKDPCPNSDYLGSRIVQVGTKGTQLTQNNVEKVGNGKKGRRNHKTIRISQALKNPEIMCSSKNIHPNPLPKYHSKNFMQALEKRKVKCGDFFNHYYGCSAKQT